MSVEKYIEDAVELVSRLKDIESAKNAIKTDAKYSTVFTTGSDRPTEDKHFKLINELLDRFDSIVYVLNSEDGEELSCIDELHRDRVLVVNEQDSTYAVKVDIFVPFMSSWKDMNLLRFDKAFLPSSFSDFTFYEQSADFLKNLMEGNEVVVAMNNRYEKHFGKVELKTPRDLAYRANSDVLPESVIDEIILSKMIGIEKVLFLISLLIKYPKFKERQAKIRKLTFFDTEFVEEKDSCQDSFIKTLA